MQRYAVYALHNTHHKRNGFFYGWSMENEFLTKEQIGQLIGVKPGTVGRWGLQGKIPRIVISPKIIRYDPARVVNHLKGAADGK